MLDSAFKYKEEIKAKMIDTWYDDKYKFYHSSSYHEVFSLPESKDGDWNCRQFVSLDSNGNVLGYMDYGIDREYELAYNFGAINFFDNIAAKATFGKDLIQVIDDIFCKFNMRKMEFWVICGNPVERSYDRLIKKYGGKIVGIRTKHCKLMDNRFYDDKCYELFREDYIKAKENKNATKK